MKRILVMVGVIVGVFLQISWVRAEMLHVVLTDDVEIQQLTEQVWLHITYVDYPGYGRISANGLIVVDGTTAAMIDTPWNTTQTGVLFDWVRQELHAEIKHVIVGHAHDDCMGGLAEAHARGATSYALYQTIASTKNAGLPIPKHGFSKSMTVKVDDTELLLHYLGGGHTRDNIVVWLPAERVLFGGCLIKAATAKNLGNVQEADLQNWPQTVKNVIEAFPNAEIVVPGHGPHGGSELLTHTYTLLMKK